VRNRIVDIADSPARLRIERRQLVIETDQPHAIPLEDLAVVVVSHPAVSYTQAVLSELAAAGGVFVACDRARMPVGLLLPIAGHSLQTERFRRQLDLSRPKQKRLWQQLVRCKIARQAGLLVERTGHDAGLGPLIPLVRSGDPVNIEARAARKYWTALFGSDFRRDRHAADHNAMLNYGYAVLRAATARAIAGAGLHPSIGLHHHNRYNAWCLADDLMEPYRPLVDRAVVGIAQDAEAIPEFDSSLRAELLAALTGTVLIAGEQRTLFDALTRTAASLAQIVTGETDNFILPEGFADAPP